MPKLNNLQQALLGFLLIGVLAAAMHFLILKGDRQRIERTKKKNAEIQANINIAKRIQESAAELQEEMNHLNAQLERLKKILPVGVNEPKFMADIKRYANENGIEILSIFHNAPNRDDVIIEHPFNYQAAGNYHDFGNFFAQLSNYPRIVNVKGLFLERKLGSYTVKGSFIISVYTYREPTEQELAEQIKAKKAAKKQETKQSKRRR